MSRLEDRYRSVLLLLPGWYRAAWEEEMVATFLDTVATGDAEQDRYLADWERGLSVHAGKPVASPPVTDHHADHPSAEQPADTQSRYAVPLSTLLAGAVVAATEYVQLQPATPIDWWTGIDHGGTTATSRRRSGSEEHHRPRAGGSVLQG